MGDDETFDDERRALQAAIDARDRFISVAAHDLKTPLSAMQLHAQMLMRGLDRPGGIPKEKMVSKLEAIRRQVGKLSGLIDDMLDVSRIARGRIDLEPTDTDLAALVRAEVAGREDLINHTRSTVAVEAPDALVGRWDPRRLRQLVGHLLDNALTFAPGPIEVQVAPGDGMTRLEVVDRGPGIPAAEHELVFQPFVRGSQHANEEPSESRTEEEGVGLGLWLVKEVVQAMSGSIELRSAPGGGAHFVINLPR